MDSTQRPELRNSAHINRSIVLKDGRTKGTVKIDRELSILGPKGLQEIVLNMKFILPMSNSMDSFRIEDICVFKKVFKTHF